MASRQAITAAVTVLYSTAGRHAGELEFRLYHEVLADLDDELLAEAVALTVRNVDLGQRPPSPALIREGARSIRRRETLPVREALPEAPETIEARRVTARAELARARTALTARDDLARVLHPSNT